MKTAESRGDGQERAAQKGSGGRERTGLQGREG